MIGTVDRGQNAGKLSANADDASYNGAAEYGFVTAATGTAPVGCDAPPPPPAGPFYGSPMVVPTNPSEAHPFNSSAPSNKIWASDFDHGGEGAAYHDIDGDNWGGAYRWDVGVDIEAVEGFTNVGWIDPGEWMNYTVDVQQAGQYILTMRVASAADNGQFHIEMDGVDVSGPFITPNTGAWATYQDMQTTVTLQAGVQVMKMVSAGGFNLISFDLQPGTVTPPATGTEMAVEGITMGWTSANGSRVTVHSTTTIVDEHGTPVEGATVTGQWSGLDTSAVSGVTNQSGQVTLSSGAVRSPSGTFTFTVTGVSGSLNYVPANNGENSDSVTF